MGINSAQNINHELDIKRNKKIHHSTYYEKDLLEKNSCAKHEISKVKIRSNHHICYNVQKCADSLKTKDNTDIDLELIKSQYIGTQKERKKIAHPSERMRFIFDWDSRDLNPFYEIPAEVTILFGRGLIAGIDRLEQQK